MEILKVRGRATAPESSHEKKIVPYIGVSIISVNGRTITEHRIYLREFGWGY